MLRWLKMFLMSKLTNLFPLKLRCLFGTILTNKLKILMQLFLIKLRLMAFHRMMKMILLILKLEVYKQHKYNKIKLLAILFTNQSTERTLLQWSLAQIWSLNVLKQVWLEMMIFALLVSTVSSIIQLKSWLKRKQD